MVMNKKLLKEYISLVVKNVLLEIGTTGAIGSISTGGTISSSSSTGTTGAGSSESTTATGGRQASDETQSSIENIEDLVNDNKEQIEKNQKSLNKAAHNMVTYTRNMQSNTSQTASGLKTAADSANKLAQKNISKDEASKAQTNQSSGLRSASDATASNSTELTKVITTLQKLEGKTTNK